MNKVYPQWNDLAVWHHVPLLSSASCSLLEMWITTPQRLFKNTSLSLCAYFPLPDSPTRATLVPGGTSKSTVLSTYMPGSNMATCTSSWPVPFDLVCSQRRCCWISDAHHDVQSLHSFLFFWHNWNPKTHLWLSIPFSKYSKTPACLSGIAVSLYTNTNTTEIQEWGRPIKPSKIRQRCPDLHDHSLHQNQISCRHRSSSSQDRHRQGQCQSHSNDECLSTVKQCHDLFIIQTGCLVVLQQLVVLMHFQVLIIEQCHSFQILKDIDCFPRFPILQFDQTLSVRNGDL